jgi:hypothetical protein
MPLFQIIGLGLILVRQNKVPTFPLFPVLKKSTRGEVTPKPYPKESFDKGGKSGKVGPGPKSQDSSPVFHF